MNLEEFVEETLLAITNGVSSAQSKSPSWIAPGRVEGEVEKSPQLVEFDISVTTSKEGDGKISVLSTIDVGGSAKSESINRISFAVPVYFQAPKNK